jgi:Putative zinc-finger/PilZ domain
MDSHSSTSELEQYADGLLSEEASSQVRAHLEVCEQCQVRLAGIGVDSQTERRVEPRATISQPGRLKLLDPLTSVGPAHDVQVVEVSEGGLKIRTPRQLLPKALVQIRFEGKSVLGVVRYCITTEAGYEAGIELRPDFPS